MHGLSLCVGFRTNIYFSQTVYLETCKKLLNNFWCYRNIQFFGADSQMQVHNAFVVVVGLGGVGSHAAVMLARSGIGKLRLVDFDQVGNETLYKMFSAPILN